MYEPYLIFTYTVYNNTIYTLSIIAQMTETLFSIVNKDLPVQSHRYVPHLPDSKRVIIRTVCQILKGRMKKRNNRRKGRSKMKEAIVERDKG